MTFDLGSSETGSQRTNQKSLCAKLVDSCTMMAYRAKKAIDVPRGSNEG
ncbi:unnamed protein product [Musa hybrid cultivar]